MKPIPTTYKGYRFRSRLEATWAAMFDLLAWPWLYEPIDLAGYIPDFILNFPPAPLLVEVKPAFAFNDLPQYGAKIAASGWDKDYLIVGAGPLEPDGLYNVLGLITEQYYPDEHSNVMRWWQSEAILFKCLECKQYSVLHNDGYWVCRRCGGYGGKHHIEWIGAEAVKALWGQAHAQTQHQWRGQ